MTYEEALAYIFSVKWTGSKPGLSRTKELLSLMGDPQKSLSFIHVAGTNGKGSTCAMLYSMLRAQGYRVGLYTSPGLKRYNDRMQVNGQEISEETLASIVEEIRPFADGMEDSPTEFEMTLAIAMAYFQREKCDVVVLEVGMGGELDATNVIDSPLAAVITPLGMDHVKELGPTLSDIARAKAGIIKPGTAVVCAPQPEEAKAVIQKTAEKKGCVLSFSDPDSLRITHISLKGITFDYKEYKGLFLPMAGTYQPNNAALAITVLQVLRERGLAVSDEAIVSGLSRVCWPGRFEVLGEDPLFILDGAHNPHGMAAAVQSIKNQFSGKPVLILTGALADKDVTGMYSMLLPYAKRFFTITPPNPRAMDTKELAKLLRSLGGEATAFPTIEEGVHAAVAEAKSTRIPVVALGSLYFSQTVRECYQKEVDKEEKD